MYIFYNNSPSGLKIGDCVVRAISTALNQPWERTYVGLCIEGFMFRDMPNANAVWASYLRSKGFLLVIHLSFKSLLLCFELSLCFVYVHGHASSMSITFTSVIM